MQTIRLEKEIDKTSKINVKIRLNDDCNNWHDDFSITWSLYENNINTEWWCIHEEIEKHFPELKIFIDLHLSDCDGVPMYAIENWMYHMKRDRDTGIKYLRICNLTDGEIDLLEKIAILDNKDMFYTCLKDLGVYAKWKEEAQKGIALMESLWFSKEWELTPRKQNYKKKTYKIDLDHAIKVKHNQEVREKKEELKISYEKEQNENTTKYNIKKEILDITLNNNYIIYSNSNTIEINRRDRSDKMKPNEIEGIKNVARKYGMTVEIKD